MTIRSNDNAINLEEAASVIRTAHIKYVVTYAKDSINGLRNKEANLHVPVLFIANAPVNEATVWCLSPKSESQSKTHFRNNSIDHVLQTLEQVCETELLLREITIEYWKPNYLDLILHKLILQGMKPFRAYFKMAKAYTKHTGSQYANFIHMMKSDFVLQSIMGDLNNNEEFMFTVCFHCVSFFDIKGLAYYKRPVDYMTTDNMMHTENPLVVTMPWYNIELFIITRHRMPMTSSPTNRIDRALDSKLPLKHYSMLLTFTCA